MKQIVLENLERITKEKILGKQFPTHVMYLELKAELGSQIGKALRELLNEGKIKAGNTLNDKFIELLK
ncbi:hypothetical protein QUH73_04395 [Labilibaculum sp. K2S]|uniref:hypothetical protein n=1 Tax=Labilibaculum sp. K2S TaxID=3056386 RepID=UPI0025A41E0F|nr:hypothetical protein [Labilibaculum sp. K2S]MDM8159055.1 hypothetical protein [Labilibaculum sp. K2S]